MRKICLTLPTNRPCAAAISAMTEEAAYAAENFGVEAHLLILDSSDEHAFTEHAKVVAEAYWAPNVVVHHLGEAEQRDFLQQVIRRADVAKPDLMLDLMPRPGSPTAPAPIARSCSPARSGVSRCTAGTRTAPIRP